jgi:site-specific recombinase XerC
LVDEPAAVLYHRTTPAAMASVLHQPSCQECASVTNKRTSRRASRLWGDTDAVAERIKIHAATAAAARPGIGAKNVTPHVLRYSFAMRLQSAGAGGPSIALLLGHESLASTRPYLHADLELKQKALDRTAPPHIRTGRYTPPDKLLAFLESL